MEYRSIKEKRVKREAWEPPVFSPYLKAVDQAGIRRISFFIQPFFDLVDDDFQCLDAGIFLVV